MVLGKVNGIDDNLSDNDDNLHTTMHNPHEFLCESHQPLEVVGIPRAPGCHPVV
jgi:hypothetical protein